VSRVNVRVSSTWGYAGSFVPARVFDDGSNEVYSKALRLSEEGQYLDRSFDPGVYLMRLALPSGDVLSQTFVAISGKDEDITFKPKRGTEGELRDNQLMLPGRIVRDVLGLELWERNQGGWSLSNQDVLDGFQVSIHRTPQNMLGLQLDTAFANPFPRDRGAHTWVQVKTSGLSVFTAIPVTNRASVLISPAGPDQDVRSVQVRVNSGRPSTEAMLGFLTSGDFQSARDIGETFLDEAEDMLREKLQDPFSAAVAGYFLLQAGKYERLHDWTRNLADWFLWLPDGPIIRACHLMTAGEPDRGEIRELLLESVRRGVPHYSIGLDLLHRRLGLLFQGAPEDVELGKALSVVGSYIDAADLTSGVVTFTGADPATPQPRTRVEHGGEYPDSFSPREPLHTIPPWERARRSLNALGSAQVPIPPLDTTPIPSFVPTAEEKPRLNIGTLGHPDHGKTTLTAAIVREFTKMKPRSENHLFNDLYETAAESDFALNTAGTSVEIETATRYYSLIDLPGHADSIKNFITAAAQMDGAILVVAATDGPMPQTKEHVLLARQVGVPYIVVFLNKCDAVLDEELLDLTEMEVRELLIKYGYPGDDVPVIRGSALGALNGDKAWETGIGELMQAVDSTVPEPARQFDLPFLMAIEGVLSVAGRGVVAIGRVERGQIKAGEEVDLVGFRETSKALVIGVEVVGKSSELAFAGENARVLLGDIHLDGIERGMVLAKPGSITAHTTFKGDVYMLSREEGGRHTPFFDGYRPQFVFGATDVLGTATLPAGVDRVMPGQSIQLEIRLQVPVALEKGLRFMILEGSRAVGSGAISEVLN
jgi:elongation factor Tu